MSESDKWPEGFFKIERSIMDCCATEGCGQVPSIRMERGGVASVYCEPCARKIAAHVDQTDQEFLDGLIGRPITVSDRVRLFALARRGAEMQTYTDDKRAYSAFANSKNASDPECTCCGGTGITYQTERRCACQPLPPPPEGEKE